jgi:ABC-type lipoprotein export system ATPase subunit
MESKANENRGVDDFEDGSVAKRRRGYKGKKHQHVPDCEEILRGLLEENIKVRNTSSTSNRKRAQLSITVPDGDCSMEPKRKRSRVPSIYMSPSDDLAVSPSSQSMSPTTGIYVMPNSGKQKLMDVLAKLAAKHSRGRSFQEKTIKLIELSSSSSVDLRSGNFIELNPHQLAEHISVNGIVNLSKSTRRKDEARRSSGISKKAVSRSSSPVPSSSSVAVAVPDFVVMGKDRNNRVAIKRAFHYNPSIKDANEFFASVDDKGSDDKLSFLALLVEKLVSDDISGIEDTETVPKRKGETLTSLAAVAKKAYDSECSMDSKTESSEGEHDGESINIDAVPRLMRVLTKLVSRYNQ